MHFDDNLEINYVNQNAKKQTEDTILLKQRRKKMCARKSERKRNKWTKQLQRLLSKHETTTNNSQIVFSSVCFCFIHESGVEWTQRVRDKRHIKMHKMIIMLFYQLYSISRLGRFILTGGFPCIFSVFFSRVFFLFFCWWKQRME